MTQALYAYMNNKTIKKNNVVRNQEQKSWKKKKRNFDIGCKFSLWFNEVLREVKLVLKEKRVIHEQNKHFGQSSMCITLKVENVELMPVWLEPKGDCGTGGSLRGKQESGLCMP
jgi:hypothetical protein